MDKASILTNYTSAMESWSGRIDSTEDYDAFRWHQWVQELDLNLELDKKDFGSGFAFIGFCSEQGVKRNKGRIGAALAPDFIRKQMSNLPCTFNPKVKLYDAGNILCDEITMEEGQRLLGIATEKILSLGLFPIVLGGGHETSFGHFQGQLEYNKKNERPLDIGIINFDAHFDLRPYETGASSGSMFRQVADIMKAEDKPFRYLPLGIQKHSNTVSLFKYAQENDVNYILAKDIRKSTYEIVLEKIDTFLYQCDSAYVTICTDVFSAAFAPGVSATQALGLEPDVVLPIIKHILRTRKIRGFDICEISPRFDQDHTTAKLGAVIIFAVVNTLCKINDLLVIDFS
jgi:formiminoglutamase